MSQAAIDQIERTKPYKGGNDDLWRLSKLDNIDKHRHLLAGASVLVNLTHDPTGADRLRRVVFPDIQLATIETVKTRGELRMLKDGDELCRLLNFGNRTESDQDPQFTFCVALDEPGVVQGEPILPFLHQLIDLVDGVVAQFVHLL
jgi:hypothetical protein